MNLLNLCSYTYALLYHFGNRFQANFELTMLRIRLFSQHVFVQEQKLENGVPQTEIESWDWHQAEIGWED